MAPVKAKLVLALLVAVTSDGLSPMSPVRAARCVFARGGAAPQLPITSREVEDAQKAWGDGIVEIGRLYTAKGDYKAEAEKVLGLYGWKSGLDVLLKPTKAADPAIRLDYEGAMSYFVGAAAADKPVAEDKGFAIHPWTAVRFDNSKTLFLSNSATAMGEYYFTDLEGGVTKVEYTFQYRRAADGALKIVVHHSSVPFAA